MGGDCLSRWVNMNETLILKELSGEGAEGREDEYFEWSSSPRNCCERGREDGRFLFVMPSPRSEPRCAKAFLRKRWRRGFVGT